MTEATSVTRRLILPPDLNHLALLGRNDEHVRVLESHDVRISVPGREEPERVLRDLVQMLREKPSRRSALLRRDRDDLREADAIDALGARPMSRRARTAGR